MVIDGESVHPVDHAGKQWAAARVLTDRGDDITVFLIKIRNYFKRDYFLKWASKMAHS